MASEDGKRMFSQRFELIEELIARLAARQQLSEDERQEVYSLVMLKIVQDDYAVLRRFRAQSRWRTYLTVVIQRVLLDERSRRWGRWRPCAAARRLGRTAIELDRWINREGLEKHEAVQMMGVGERGSDAGELMRLVERIPKRVQQRTAVSARCLASEHGADRAVEVAEKAALAGGLSASLRAALGELSDQDRALLAMRFADARTVRRIAADLGLETRPLYRRFERLLRRLRWRLESQGLTWDEIRHAVSDRDVELELGAILPRENAGARRPHRRPDRTPKRSAAPAARSRSPRSCRSAS